MREVEQMNRIRIKNSIENKQIVLLSIFIFFPIYEPIYFREIEWLHSLFFAYKLIVYSVVIILFVVQKWKISTITFFLILFCIELLAVTAIRANDALLDASKIFVSAVIAVFFLENGCEKDTSATLKGLAIVHAVLIYINFFVVLLYSEGLYEPANVYFVSDEKYYLLGHNNQATRYLLPGIFYSTLYDYIKYNRIRWWSFLLAFIAMTTVVLTWSNTGMVGCGILVGYMVFLSGRHLSRLFNAKIFLGISIGLCLLFVVFQKQEIFTFIIEDFFKKDLSLTGRTVLWEAAMFKIMQLPIWGSGYVEEIIEARNITDYITDSAHNFFLDVLLRGGFIGLFLILIVVVLACWKLDTAPRNSKTTLTSFVLLAYFIMWITMPFIDTNFVDMILVFIIAYNVKKFHQSKKQKTIIWKT
jgi:O-antigen ligase